MIKTDEEIGNLRESGHRLAEVMDELLAAAVPGTTTGRLGELAEELIRQKGGIPVFKGYGAEWGKPFPAAVCTSVNHEIVHGIPSSDRVLREGDLLKLDIGLRFRGMVSDMARTKASEIANLLKAVADPTRLQILALVNKSEDSSICTCDLTGPLGLSQPTVSHHMKKLTEVGLLTAERKGTWVHYSINKDRWNQISELFE